MARYSCDQSSTSLGLARISVDLSSGMPETTNERLRCGRDGSGRHPQNQAEKTPEEPRSSTLLQPRELVLPPTSGGQSYNDVSCRIHPAPALPSHIQYRPSVLRQGTQSSSSPASRCRLENGSSQLVPMCKVEVQVDAAQHGQSSPMHAGSSPRLTGHSLPPRRGSPKQNSMESRVHDENINHHPHPPSSSRPPGSQTASALFVSGLCRWPGCDAALEDFSSFLKHLHSKHSHDEKSVAQWRVQQDMVHYMERQLTLERQKLFAMQLHLHISERNLSDLAVSDWPYSMAAFLSQPPETDGNGAVDCAALGDLGDLAHHSYWPTATVHFLPDLVPSIECYKYRNIRPPYTYAHLIRWAILESPDKQRTLNEIYTWFTSMFFYFRHNTATWKNAVRHNLSLHKCFVRVEGAKGAVWIVDEAEFQRRKAQKYYRDHPAKWMTPYTQFCPEQP